MMLTLNINDKYFDIVDRLQPIICWSLSAIAKNFYRAMNYDQFS